jgi:hypothetical protein
VNELGQVVKPEDSGAYASVAGFSVRGKADLTADRAGHRRRAFPTGQAEAKPKRRLEQDNPRNR